MPPSESRPEESAIAEAPHALEAAREREAPDRVAWYGWLFEHSLDGILLTTPAGGIIVANPAACRLLGYTEAELRAVGRAGVVDPDDPRVAAAIEERRRTGRFVGSITLLAKDGRRVPVDISSRVFTDAHGNELTSMFMRDAAARLRAEEGLRQSEERFRVALRGSPTVVYTTDADLRYTWIYNPPPAYRIEDVLGKRDDEILPSARAAELTALKREVIATGRGLRREVRVTVGDEERVYDITAEPLRDRDGRVAGLTVAATDITERWRRDAERASLLDEARRATALRDQVLSIVSHDLRTPLSAISMVVAALEQQSAPSADTVRRVVDVTRRSVEQMDRLIRDLLDVASIDAGRLAIERGPEDLAALLAVARASFERRFEDEGVELRWQIPDGLPRVDVDGERILQVVGNLLANAAKIVPRGGHVTVAAAPDGSEVVVSVRDDGPGIPSADVPHVFDRFWHARRAARSRGTGLGLSIAKAIVDAHGGRIWVDAAEGRGATFAFTVPVFRR